MNSDDPQPPSTTTFPLPAPNSATDAAIIPPPLLPSSSSATVVAEAGAGEAGAGAPRRAEKRDSFLDHLILNLDIAVYCQLSILYYLDSSLLHLLLRALPQFLYFTPKPAYFPPQPPHRPYLLAITVTNFLCMLLHILSSPRTAGEATRGYLHGQGGLLIDFVGVQGPIGRGRLVGLDVVVWGLQMGVLAVVIERRGLGRGGGGADGAGASTDGGSGRIGQGGGGGQDLEAEEMGVRRSQEEDGIELQQLRALVEEGEGSGDGEVENGGLVEHPLDIFATGEHVIMNLHPLDTIRTSWRWHYGVSPGGTAVTGSTDAATPATAAN